MIVIDVIDPDMPDRLPAKGGTSALVRAAGYGHVAVDFENLPDLAAAHAAARSIKLESALEGMPVPLHPGAARYFKEKGLKVGS